MSHLPHSFLPGHRSMWHCIAMLVVLMGSCSSGGMHTENKGAHGRALWNTMSQHILVIHKRGQLLGNHLFLKLLIDF